MTGPLTHIDADGRVRMVDVSAKPATLRTAEAEGLVRTSHAAFQQSDSLAKGDVRAAAEIAGVMAAKKTSELIPLCHPIALTSVKVVVEPQPDLPGFLVRARAQTTGQTGVEMEALTAVTVACLTLYDMLKAADRAITIEAVRLVSKTGGASGAWRRPD